jgi:hypothetical protein
MPTFKAESFARSANRTGKLGGSGCDGFEFVFQCGEASA